MRWSLLLACASLLACIERPQTPRSRAASFDRSGLGEVLLAGAPSPVHPVNAVFGESLELVGYDVQPEPATRGAPVEVTFYWRVLGPVNDDWKVFVHLDDEGRQAPRIIGDHFPAQERYPTSAWRTGEVIRDAWRFTAPSGPVDALSLWTGLYRGDTRLPLTNAGRGVSDGQNRVRAGSIPLR